jgi:hypothetical protein
MINIEDALKLSITFGFLGFIFSSRMWIKTIDKLTPTKGLLIYYIIIYISIYILSQLGLVIGHSKITNYIHTLGVVMILFSFFIIFNWESEYINIVTKGDFDNKKISKIYLQSEDGATFDFYYNITKNIELSRILTFVVTPIVLTFVGSILIEKKIKLVF